MYNIPIWHDDRCKQTFPTCKSRIQFISSVLRYSTSKWAIIGYLKISTISVQKATNLFIEKLKDFLKVKNTFK